MAPAIVGTIGATASSDADKGRSDMSLFDGITERVIETTRLSVNILERAGDDPSTPA